MKKRVSKGGIDREKDMVDKERLLKNGGRNMTKVEKEKTKIISQKIKWLLQKPCIMLKGNAQECGSHKSNVGWLREIM